VPKDASAPGSLELVRSFVNSIDLERPETTDAFADALSARLWLAGAGLEATTIEPAELAGLRELREILRAVLLAHNSDGDPAATWWALAVQLGPVRLEVHFGLTGGADLQPAEHRGAAALRGALAAAVYDAMRDGTWPRLKACRKHSCLYAFYDRTKNGCGAWCSMDTCGNREKAARRRERERSTAST